MLSVVISPFSFLILLIWFFSLCFLMSLANGLSILFILSKNQLLVVYSTFKCSFDEFVGEKVFSLSYSSAILAPPLYMEFRKMVTITLYERQQKRPWCIEQSFGLCGKGRGWDDLGEWHWNMYNIIYETNHQSRFDAWYWMRGVGALRRPRGMVRGGRWERGSGWGTRVYLWRIHVDVWQNQYNIVK